jgi:NACHT domain/N-terminal domain of NWD NACHT-NTPase
MMQWYGELSVLLLREDTVNAEESAGVRGQLERRVIRLYEALLLYLIRSVYAFNRYRLVAFIRDVVKLDDWEGSLVGVEDAENAVRQGSEAYNSHQIRRSLEEILEVAKNQESKLLRDIYSVLQQQISVQLKKEDQECIQNLRTTNPRHDKKRIEDTKGGLLSDSYRWVLQNQSFKDWRDDQQTRLLWIKGNPGKGKTMLICGIVNELEKSMIKTERLSYFFCQATDSRINNATSVLRGLLYMLLDQQPSLTSHIRKRYDKERKALFDDVNAFVALSEIFTDILQDPSLKSAYLIIDALDECEYDLPKLLGFIRQMASSSPHVKWIISSRNWPKIEEVLKKTRHKVDLSLELNDEDIYTAVKTYIKHKVSELADDKDYDEETQVEVEDYLSSNANGTYLWVALVCQNLKAIESWHTLDRLKEFPPKLDSLYDQMLKTIKDSNDADLCMRILASNAVLYRPITLEELVSVVNMPKALSDKPKLLESIIGLCGSFLTIRDGTIYFVHQSAKDYLVTDAFDRIFPSGAEPVHYEIFSRSLQVMSTLQRDIYRLRAPGYPIEQVKPPDSDPLQASRYSCIYCIRHLCDSISSPDAIQTADFQDGGKVDIFVRNKFLYWLEALSLCKGMSEGLLSMAKLDALIQVIQVQRRYPCMVHTDMILGKRRCIRISRASSRCAPIYHVSQAGNRELSSSGVCVCTLVQSDPQPDKVSFQRGRAEVDHDQVGYGRYLECLSADARGPQRFCPVGGLLSRLSMARVSVV